MANIVITPSELRECAQNLEKLLDEYKEHIEAVDKRMLMAEVAWLGKAKDEVYKQYYEELQPFLKDDIPNVVDTLVEELYGVAQAIDDTDEEIASSLS
ncbi:MAG: hypothetical protein IJ535_09500 [Pseudobutyrivibrio sp.]|uniref:WXG100 family type VII secretion target n=1 Tax=Pseudobutyrivibrio sp. TaxID=2014367 RepID=UPI0025CE7293|nr:hypothetical protein [Pseudobutyrivibrio sp.]MBQ8489999.1 hypothetical protein [Pseudobutyrivibrio sp.]